LKQLKDYLFYEDDWATIYCGDCRIILPMLEPVDLVLTDPPYGVNKAEWDKEIIPPITWLPLCQSICRLILITPGNKNQWEYPRPDWTAAWFRPGSIQRAAGGGFSHWEPILIYGNNPLPFDCKQFNANQEPTDGHPTPKPILLFRWLISESQSETILDPFLGSGTTCVAAKNLNRKSIGIEINPKYCEIAVKRLRQEVFDFRKA